MGLCVCRQEIRDIGVIIKGKAERRIAVRRERQPRETRQRNVLHLNLVSSSSRSEAPYSDIVAVVVDMMGRRTVLLRQLISGVAAGFIGSEITRSPTPAGPAGWYQSKICAGAYISISCCSVY